MATGLQKIDSAVEALPEEKWESLRELATSCLRFKLQGLAISVGLFVAVGMLFLLLRQLLWQVAPGSLFATILAAAVWISALIVGLQVLTSLRLSQWRIRLAMRREFLRS